MTTLLTMTCNSCDAIIGTTNQARTEPGLAAGYCRECEAETRYWMGF